MIIEVTPFVVDCSDKEQACKLLEEAAEAFGAWQRFYMERQIYDYASTSNDHTGTEALSVRLSRRDLADEIADVIEVACNLAYRYGIDVAEAMRRCTERQRARGRL